eukprot:TRINITY_DN66822_c1_g2_i2.p1 TRINITY_DN66822_c1_g2~~TRINITY_DN66822_c1_g2_i2.p1  ORF type:complete len:189 (-),score=6.74 TRINITY_DN66822_c1_g2_i2:100-666(-)
MRTVRGTIRPAKGITVDQFFIPKNAPFPNNAKLPLLHYRNVIDLNHGDPRLTATKFLEHKGWTSPWEGEVYPYHHYHTIAWEALLIVQGEASVQFGGEDGPVVHVEVGDGIVIPPGVAHKALSAKGGFACFGIYPNETPYVDESRTEPTPTELENIAKCPQPKTDPWFGSDRPWSGGWAELISKATEH